MIENMSSSFRVKIISPLEATESDLARRQQRYTAQAGPYTLVMVDNLTGGPAALGTSGDVLASAAAIFQRGKDTSAADYDAILIDCVFDPAVDELREATGIPTFGPTRVTLPLIQLVSPNFSIIARTIRQCELLADLVNQYGYSDSLCSLRALEISYDEAKQPEIFNQVMLERLASAINVDGAQAIMFGSTTMALTDEMRAKASNAPLFMPGMVALKVIEQLWFDNLWPY